MAEYGEWNRKGSTLSDVTAKKEYGVDREFINRGIETGKLEYRHGSVWGNPYIKVLRRELEEYVKAELGQDYLTRVKGKTELPKIKKEISELQQKLSELQARKAELERVLKK
jgi:hypothetical protein